MHSAHPMKVVITTSQVTFVPGNYKDALIGLLERRSDVICAVAFFGNLDWHLVKSLLGMYALGAPRLGSTLLKNILSLPSDPRKKAYKAKGKEVLQFKDANDPRFLEYVRREEVDLVLNMRTRSIFKDSILSAPRLGCVNVHHGILPEHRGTMCDLQALAEGRPAGFSVHKMTRKIDDGDIFARAVASTPGEKNYVNYLKKTGPTEAEVISQFLNEVRTSGGLPEGTPNTSSNIQYSKTPRTRAQVVELKAKEIVL
jgi:methionyl-tRNA formyltransferase